MNNASSRQRIQDEPAFILHSYPFRETSLILEVFSRQYGRLPLVARGARRPRSVLRGVLMAFQPLQLSWFGKHELRTLHAAEWQGGQPQLSGTALMCGFYMNELLLNLLARDDAHPELFDDYRDTLLKLAHEQDHALTLRRFEKRLLQQLGYGLTLTHGVDGRPIEADRSYRYILERGAVAENAELHGGLPIRGKTLLDMAADDYRDAASARQSKQLIRLLLDHYLDGRTLHTREVMKDLQKR
ncbi:MAG: DNA repair protein RecO [Sideroxydans sp.]